MRDDSVLATGSSSAAFGSTKEAQKVAKVREDALDDKKEKRAKLKPVAQLIKDEIQKELDAIRNNDTVNVETDAESLKAEMMGRVIAKNRLISFQNRILNVLREQ